MNRKKDSFITETKKLILDIQEMKETQFFGSDTTLLLKGESGNTYDEMILLSGNSRIDRFVTYTPVLEDWQNSHYSQIHVQVWINNMSTPYFGNTSGISVLPPQENNLGRLQKIWQQVVNLTATDVTLYIKYYVVSTTVGGSISVTS